MCVAVAVAVPVRPVDTVLLCGDLWATLFCLTFLQDVTMYDNILWR
jgi:hypothetical protein